MRELAVLFFQVGIPKQLIMGQGANFMSELLAQMGNFWGIQPLHTTVIKFHPQMNGLAECFNGTLKHMLQKYVGENERDWPQ